MSENLQRIFVPSLGGDITLEDNEFHHLIHVLRKEAGNLVEAVDGKGGLAKARITNIGKKRAQLEILESSHTQRTGKQFFLAQAMLKPSRLDWLVEKAVELGVSGIWLFPSERSVISKLSPNQQDRFQKEAISALKQSKNLFLPEIKFLPSLKLWERPIGALFYGSLKLTSPHLFDLCHPWEKSVFFVGPEGGFTEDEIKLLDNWQTAAVRIHNHTLRAETAAICGLSFLSFLSNFQTNQN